MKLILLLSFCILTFELTVTNKGEIFNGVTKTINSNGYCVFADVDRYSGSYIRAKVTVKNGRFNEDIMYWGGYFSKPSTGTDYGLNVYETYSSSEYDSKIGGDNYNTFTYTFKITRNTFYNYIFLAIPRFSGDYVDIQCTSGGLSIVAIAFIIIGCIALFIILISIIIYMKKRRNASYTAPVVTINSPTYTPPSQQLYEPAQQVYNPVQPAYNPGQPVYNPGQPGYDPVQPAYVTAPQPMDIPPAQPTYTPNYPPS